MPFVTKYKLKRALGNIDGQFWKDPIFKYLQSKYFYLPNKETALLTVYNNFIEDPEKFVEEGHKVWKDSGQYAIEKAPAYHKDNSCQALLMNFDNVKLPPQIQKNDLLLDYVRQIADEVGLGNFGVKTHEILAQYVDLCIERMFKEHNLRFSQGDFEIIVQRKNSGNKEYSNLTMNDLKTYLDNLKKQANEYFGLNEKGILVIPNSFFTTPMNYPDKLEKHNRLQVLERYREFIKLIAFNKNVKNNNTDFCSDDAIIKIAEEIKENFIDPTYYAIEEEVLQKVENIDFKKTVLRIIGFQPCQGCSPGDDLTQNDENYIGKYKIG